jgi:DNA-binding winged helix-turn-helix (wHTH) protein/serine/threonine protein kinase
MHAYHFGPFRVDTVAHCLLRDEEELPIAPLPFAVLVFFLENRDELVTKERLLREVWDVESLTDDAIYQCIRSIRIILGDGEESSKYIKTVPRLGYRFAASVRVTDLSSQFKTPLSKESAEVMMSREENDSRELSPKDAISESVSEGDQTVKDSTLYPLNGSIAAQRKVDDPKTLLIQIGEATAVEVDACTGEIVGPNAEGTLGIVLYGGAPQFIEGQRFESEKAVRIPRLLQSDILLNFHVGEIAYHESRQAAKFLRPNSLLGAMDFYRFEEPNAKIHGSNDHCYLGFYMSPTSRCALCLVSEKKAWPPDFESYLEKIDKTQKLFHEIGRCAESKDKDKKDIFTKLLFLPDRRDNRGTVPKGNSLLEVVSRDTLPVDFAKREVKGWWFNVPVAVYPWMTTNLERLLAECIDDTAGISGGNNSPSLRDWELRKWFQLVEQMTSGLLALHEDGAIHGDPRPANIMTDIPNQSSIGPYTFRWIDIGLGYGTQEHTPRPLGGGRSSIFYAPERDEAREFEDADCVNLKPYGSQQDFSELTFRWRKQTRLESAILPLRKGETPLRELGKLTQGDRIQVREFLFEVERVEEQSVIVSRIYEIFLDRLLVEKKSEERSLVHKNLQEASISRYRIFQQWSQATDVYGLGMITLYMFFIRGLFRVKKWTTSSVRESSGDLSSSSSIYDRSNREAIFSELAILLRNRSFLENLVSHLATMELGNLSALQKELNEPKNAKVEVAKEISEWIRSTDTNFDFIWHGVNQNHSLFSQVIYFCLCCLWRQDEVKEINDRQTFKFEPFCPSRQMLKSPDHTVAEQTAAAKAAASMVEDLIPIAHSIKDVEGRSDSRTHRDLLVDRERQMITLREDLKIAKAQIKNLEDKLSRRNEKAAGLFVSIRNEAQGIEHDMNELRVVLPSSKASKASIESHLKKLRELTQEGESVNGDAESRSRSNWIAASNQPK